MGFLLAGAAGTVRAAREQAFQLEGGARLRFVESPAQAAPGTWYIGACGN
ncbi:hypothetical protein ACFQFC_32935 [Amorphoplanes digitatis]|uniref:Uncharacterized protein n=1 Tax=Actinoplanes digitatis TaxID=1868 RepID=A0A7W7HUH1_9ACTN|nr:hypothetical protein [Actinoplanes digitatis]MBB4760964.1 hypothetical protein [Actinoplanes digitatis]BFE69265.1 hypothetical protein GCM10020092_025660 [Actinoplanes digitatis]GID95273.1 hypothetical protein Adi01nite_46850 [Actinoplanes digitatis]